MLVALAGVAVLAGAVSGPAGAAKRQAGVWNVKAGQTVTFSGLTIFGCNNLVGGVVWGDTSTDTLATVAGGAECASGAADTVFGPFSEAQTFRLYLQDVSCDRTYYSDGTSTGGTSSDHVTIAKRRLVSFADAGFFGDSCPRADTDFDTIVGEGNFNVTVSISRH
jgi:hypothetical protein